MSSACSTPAAKRTPPSSAEAAQGSLGVLAALASPTPAAKDETPTHSAEEAADGDGGTKTTLAPTHNTRSSALLKTPKLECSSPERSSGSNQGSLSPPHSPSTQAAIRKVKRGTSSIDESTALSDSQGSYVPGDIPDRPAAVPATQLDVLALVTATSPPMPSRRGWIGHSTPKPAFPQPKPAFPQPDPAATTPTRAQLSRSAGDAGSDSDTVSEDEQTLRTYSSRRANRHQSVQMRELSAGASPPDRTSTHEPYPTNSAPLSARALPAHGDGSRATSYHLRQSASARAPRTRNHPKARGTNRLREKRKADDGSSGDTTETDEEMSSLSQTPVVQRSAAHGIRSQQLLPNGADLSRRADSVDWDKQPDSGARAYDSPRPGGAVSRVPPASEPTAHRRSRRRLNGHTRGVVLKKQLSELSEEAELASQQPHMSSNSLSPPPSPLREHRRSARRTRATSRLQMSESETETDTELAARVSGSETETEAEAEVANSTTSNSAQLTGSRRNGRIHHNNSRNGGATQLRNASHRPVSDGLIAAAATRDHLHAARPPLPPVHASRSRSGSSRRNGHSVHGGSNNDDSGGETTETDDDFFGPPRAVHSSIRPPRRVVRQIANLRARHPQPVALPLGGSRPMDRGTGCAEYAHMSYDDPQIGSNQPRTAPTSAVEANRDDGMGLGISSQGPRQRNGSSRVLSTPSMAASSSATTAIFGAPASPYARDGEYYSVSPQDQQPQYRDRPHQLPPRPGYASVEEPSSFSNDPFAPGSDEFTFRGAARRRLEKPHHGRGSNGSAEEARASRKRALTAPSSFDPALRRRVPYALGNKMLSSAESLQEDEREYGAATGYCTPPERSRHIGSRAGLLGESPVSSLRSSLLAQPHIQAPVPPQPQFASPARIPSRASTSNAQPGDREHGDGAVEMLAGSASPSMDAALRQNRKRHRTPSLAAADSPPSPASRQRSSESVASVGSSTATRAAPSRSADMMFPPIEHGAS
ncbi:hypothetical protein H4R20_003615 [Coemansia guatemalensis]|uniref:Uncharacterized protein n=1 Tax=Coemansia guatemalensis TaxID=2761395 RepID=A0A9W8HV97_9FUNG|nr:hypothetical protein H4R20_003615 [Coemansia guatemalensis]